MRGLQNRRSSLPRGARHIQLLSPSSVRRTTLRQQDITRPAALRCCHTMAPNAQRIAQRSVTCSKSRSVALERVQDGVARTRTVGSFGSAAGLLREATTGRVQTAKQHAARPPGRSTAPRRLQRKFGGATCDESLPRFSLQATNSEACPEKRRGFLRQSEVFARGSFQERRRCLRIAGELRNRQAGSGLQNLRGRGCPKTHRFLDRIARSK